MIRVLYGFVVVLIVAVFWQVSAISKAYDFLENGAGIGAFGAERDKADVTLLAFVDYTSSFSQDINAALLQAAEDDGRTRVRFYPLPQPSDPSVRAAKLIIAAANQGKYLVMHDELMRNDRPLTDEAVREMASRQGIDADKLLADEKSENVAARLTGIINASRKLRVEYIPSVIANRKIMFYSPDVPADVVQFRKLIQESRS